MDVIQYSDGTENVDVIQYSDGTENVDIIQYTDGNPSEVVCRGGNTQLQVGEHVSRDRAEAVAYRYSLNFQ